MLSGITGLVLASAAVITAAAPQPPPIVNTSLGAVLGSWSEVLGIPIASWRGIPFAAPPVSELRWRPPQAPDSWSGVRNCTSYATECAQGGDGSEDCLYLNVDVSNFGAGAPAAAAAPTMAYIHGGGLTGGNAFLDLRTFIARVGGPTQRVCAVTLAYRLNIFGFLATAELSEEQGGSSGNYGILDQQAALRWLQANAAAFGCDAARVTVAGQSSGGTSIFALLSSPASAGLFWAGIPLSGSTNLSLDMRTAEVQNGLITAVAGCGANATAAARVACLRAAPREALRYAVPRSWGTPGLWGLPKTPLGQLYAGVVIVDGRVVTHNLTAALAAGLVDVPLLLGNMGFEPARGPEANVSQLSGAEWDAFLGARFALWGPGAAAAVGAQYAADAAVSPQKAYDAISADAGLTCSFPALARAAKAGGGVFRSPLYVYVNNWGPSGSGPAWLPPYAFHYWDLAAATETWFGPGYTPSAGDLRLSAALQGWWWALMVNGSLPAGTGWPSVEAVPSWPASYATFVIDGPDQAAPGPRVVEGFKNETCGVYAQLGIDQRFWWCD